MVASNSSKVLGTSRDTTRSVTAKAKTASEKPSMRETSCPRQRKSSSPPCLRANPPRATVYSPPVRHPPTFGHHDTAPCQALSLTYGEPSASPLASFPNRAPSGWRMGRGRVAQGHEANGVCSEEPHPPEELQQAPFAYHEVRGQPPCLPIVPTSDAR